jgi:chemotaxis protein methyltransferase CheR
MVITPDSFEFIRTVLRERSANRLEDDKSYLVETRLLPLARRQGCHSVEEFVAQLRGNRPDALLDAVVEAMVIHETSFFRDGLPFDSLKQRVVPEVVRARTVERRLNIWSAACATGQEPYSVAMALREASVVPAGWQVRVLASDLSATLLDRARRGRYTALEVSRGLTPVQLGRWFHRDGEGWQICDELRGAVEFRSIRLETAWPVLPPMDVVLLRNVLIYFDAPTRQRILERVRRLLRPDGYLLLGGAEMLHNLDEGLVLAEDVPGGYYRLKG